MSRSTAAATAAGRQRALPRQPGPRHDRRISGPARARVDASVLANGAVAYPRPQRAPARPPLRVVAGGAAIATRVADIALDVSGSRLMDRLVRSRIWIGIIAFGLIGIVAMQVSMLKLNAGVGRAVETASTLERTNATLRGEVSRLSNGDRIQSLASARGFVMPAPADVTYLRSGDAREQAARAAARMHAPDATIAGPAGSPIEAAAAVAALAAPPVEKAAETAFPADPAATDPAAATTTPPAAATTPPATPPAPVAAAPAVAPPTSASTAGGVAPPTATAATAATP
jgi:hypothetical protein